MPLKFKLGMQLLPSKSDPDIRRWQKANRNVGINTKHINDGASLQDHFAGHGHGEVFEKAIKNLNVFNKRIATGTNQKKTLELYEKTVIRSANKKKDIRILGFPIWVGPHYDAKKRRISIHPDDMKPGKRGLNKAIAEIAKGDFGTVLIHESAHAWDFCRGEAEGHPEKSYWLSVIHPKIREKCKNPPVWMRADDNPMGRFAYAGMVPHEMPSVMSEMAHIDPARYHAAHELFKEDYGVDLDAHLTEFWGTKITPPRPADGSVEKLKEDARKPPKKWIQRNVRKASPDLWDEAESGVQHIHYAEQSGEDTPNITRPDHRCSNLPWEVLEMLFPQYFEPDPPKK